MVLNGGVDVEAEEGRARGETAPAVSSLVLELPNGARVTFPANTPACSTSRRRPRFFAGTQVPSMKPSGSSMPPRFSRSRRRPAGLFGSTPESTQC
jgi:hypothetical protein